MKTEPMALAQYQRLHVGESLGDSRKPRQSRAVSLGETDLRVESRLNWAMAYGSGKSSLSSANRNAGVTLLELTIAILLIGIFAAVAAPVYSNSLHRFRVDIAAQRIAQDVTRAQRIAQQTNSTRTISFATTDDSCAISGVNSLDRASQPYRVLLNQSPYQVKVSSLVDSATPSTQVSNLSVAFNRFGMPDRGIIVTVRAGAFQRRVDVAPISGRVTIQ